MNRCGDIKWFNLKSATLWSSPKILHRASGAHGEVVTWVSCHKTTPMWRYVTLPVLNQICREFKMNWNWDWNWKSFDSFLSGGSTDVVSKVSCKSVKSPGRSSKNGFSTFWEFAQKKKKNGRRKWAWPTPRDSAQFNECVDIRFLNARQSILELLAKTHFP